MNIKFDEPSVQGLFSVTYKYRVPLFQRGYAWGPTEIDDFWNDISGTGAQGHFLGPMVLHHSEKDPAARSVIDGQQRLTTLQILLALIRDEYVAFGDPVRPNAGTSTYSDGPAGLIQSKGYTAEFRLQAGEANNQVLQDFVLRSPTDPKRSDVDDTKAVGDLPKATQAKNKPLLEATRRLRRSLKTYLAEVSGVAPQVARLASLEDALINRVSVVVLELTDLDDAYLLFETLNDRGLRLSAADLLKSHLLSRFSESSAGSPAVVEKASSDWDDMIDLLGGGDISGFLRHYLLLRHKKVKKSDVFPYFKKDIKSAGPDKALAELTEMGLIYADFLHPDPDPHLRDLESTSTQTHRVAMLPAKKWLNAKQLAAFATAAEVLAFRWMVTGGNAQVLESTFQEAAETLHQSNGKQYDEALRSLTDKVPADDLFRVAFREQALGYQYVAAYVLRKIETYLTPNSEKQLLPGTDVHIEHILPRSATPYWKSQLRSGHVHEEVVDRWGNLTLLLGKVNSSISNGDWTKKRAAYSGSSVALTQDLGGLAAWTSDDIFLRGEWLADVAVQVWSIKPTASTAAKSYSAFLSAPRP